MSEFSCSVKVVDTQPQAFGAVARIEFFQPSVGIDVSPEGIVAIHLTEDAGAMFTPGAILRMTFSDQETTPGTAPTVGANDERSSDG
jgi:hypothetical protein